MNSLISTGIPVYPTPPCPDASGDVVTIRSGTGRDYVAFGLFIKTPDNKLIQYERAGYNHLIDGVILRREISWEDASVLSEDIVYDLGGTNDWRAISIWIANGSIWIYSFVNEDGHDPGNEVQRLITIKSTDGYTGMSFSEVSSELFTPSGNMVFIASYGNVPYINGYYWINRYYGSLDYLTYGRIEYLLIDAAGTVHDTKLVYEGSTYYNETTIVGNGNNLIALSRRDLSPNEGFWASVSTDGGDTWTNGINTLLVPTDHKCHGILKMNSKGLVDLIYTNRENSEAKTYLSVDNVLADIVADPTNWNTPIMVGGSWGQLGHPDMIELCADTYLIKYSTEVNSTQTRINTKIIKTA